MVNQSDATPIRIKEGLDIVIEPLSEENCDAAIEVVRQRLHGDKTEKFQQPNEEHNESAVICMKDSLHKSDPEAQKRTEARHTELDVLQYYVAKLSEDRFDSSGKLIGKKGEVIVLAVSTGHKKVILKIIDQVLIMMPRSGCSKKTISGWHGQRYLRNSNEKVSEPQ